MFDGSAASAALYSAIAASGFPSPMSCRARCIWVSLTPACAIQIAESNRACTIAIPAKRRMKYAIGNPPFMIKQQPPDSCQVPGDRFQWTWIAGRLEADRGARYLQVEQGRKACSSASKKNRYDMVNVDG